MRATELIIIQDGIIKWLNNFKKMFTALKDLFILAEFVRKEQEKQDTMNQAFNYAKLVC